MKRFLFLFLFLPFVCLPSVQCEIRDIGNEQLSIVCWSDTVPDDPMIGTNVLSQADCEYLKSLVANAISNAVDTLLSVRHNLDSYLQEGGLMQRLNGYISDIYDQLADITGNQAQVAVIDTKVGLLDDGLSSIYNDMVGNVGAIDQHIDNLRAQTSQVDQYVCTAQSCTGNGNGTYSCPCQDVLDNILSSVNVIKTHTIEIARLTSSNHVMLVQIAAQMDQIYQTMELVKNRLTAPDDRMWGELNDLYSNLYSNLNTIATSQLNVNDLLYNIKELVRGTGNDNNLQLTTEGVISLYSSLFGMARTVQDQYNYRAFDDSVRYFSNTVSRLFLSFNDMFPFGKNRPMPPDANYPFIYDVFTNNNDTARARYRHLVMQTQGNATNWFTRMELYQQAALGWFDDQSKTELEQEQDRTTESSIEDSFGQTTNRLGSVTSAGTDLTNSVLSVFSPVVDDLANAEVIASLPTRIMFIEAIDLGNFGEIPDLYLDTSQISDYCDLARKVSTLIWKVLIWGLYVALAVGIGRVVFILVLYIIHFVQNL